METELKQLIEVQQQKIDLVYASVEKTRKYMLCTMIGTLAFFVLPLLALLLIVPAFISNYASTITEIGL